ncbi:MAG: hypothetical protein IPP14_04450 [Planctomycetes bacterium]|nr:hypothetical protein [Planctomycetota bacterium]
MTEALEVVVSDVRRYAAAGDFTSARKRLAEHMEAYPNGPVAQLNEHRRTLEVLESLEVVRQLLRDGKTASAARAAEGIRDALNSTEYAQLGILGAALALLGRASDLARRAESGERSPMLGEELGAFVEYLSSELNHLQTEQVDRRLQRVLQPAQTADAAATATLGDLLSRRPWRTNLLPTVSQKATRTQAEPEPQSQAQPADPVQAAASGTSPVIGRILIAQEQTERIAPVVQPQTATGSADTFDLVGRAALRYWHIVAGCAVIAAAIGYLAVLSAPQKYQSSSLLQKTPQSRLRAPITGNSEDYVTSLPSQTVLQLATLDPFRERVSRRLTDIGWTESGKPDPNTRIPITREEVAGALTVNVDNTGGGIFSIRFTAVSRDRATAQAIAGAAAEEFRQLHYEHMTREAGANLADYEKRQKDILAQLDKLYQRRLQEFAVENTDSVGVTLKDRIDQIILELRNARTQHDSLALQLTAARQAEQSLAEIALRIPPYEELAPDAKLLALHRLQADMEKDLFDLLRKRSDLGPEHPMQRRIRDLQEDLNLVEKEIEELERTNAADVDKRKVSPLRAAADSRVAEAKAASALLQLQFDAVGKDVPKLEGGLSRLREQYLASETLRRDETSLVAQKERNEVILEELSAVSKGAERELTLLSPASQSQPVPRQELVGIAIGLIAGLIIGIGIAVALLRRRQLDEAEFATA